jgi:hypothetical protein
MENFQSRKIYKSKLQKYHYQTKWKILNRKIFFKVPIINL